MKIIGYIRVSTEYQAESKHGLDAQLFAIQKYSKQTNTPLHEIFRDEALSGSLSLEKRPGMLSAINSLARGDLLVVAKRDRLGRDALVMAMIESAVKRKGAKIISLAGEGTENDDPTGMLMRRMIDAFSEYERLIIGIRVSAALQAKKTKGERIGYIPFGYKLQSDGVHLDKHSPEQTILEEMYNLREKGHSIREIAKIMNDKNLLNRNGNKWNHSSILRVCINRVKKRECFQ
jgi:DNA invertase Pin-like site-specific DNA recombinase